MERLHGTNALVTGAAGGLGHAIARALAAEGANLVLADLPGIAALDELAEELAARGVRAEVVTADLTDREQTEGLIAAAEEALGPLDLLVNNAGLEFGGSFESNSLDEIQAITDVNLKALMILTRQAVPGMLARRRGHVVNIASLAGKTTPPYLSTYVATKHGVVGFTHSLRAEHGNDPVSFSAICPAFVGREGMYGRLQEHLPDPPPYLKPFPPERVGEAVVSAIRDDRAEVIVNERPLKWLVALSSLAPGLMARLANTPWARRFSEEAQTARAKVEGTGAAEAEEAGTPQPEAQPATSAGDKA
jgi:short-subunit dehydrogenase